MLMRQLLLMTACRRSAERDGSLKKNEEQLLVKLLPGKTRAQSQA